MEKRKGLPLPAASSSFSAGIARSAASEAAPSCVANWTPSASVSASGRAGSVRPMIAPLSPIAPAIRPFDSGEAICALTEAEPADSPAIVTRFGSPPKAAMFSLHPDERRALVEEGVVARGLVRATPCVSSGWEKKPKMPRR